MQILHAAQSFPSINMSPQQSNGSGLKKNMNERQDSTYSKNGPYPLYDTSRSTYSSPVTSISGTRLQGKMEELGKFQMSVRQS